MLDIVKCIDFIYLQSIEKFYGSRDCEVTSLRRFSFSESLEKASLEIHFERQLAGGWSLAQLGCSTKVSIVHNT